LSEKYKFVSWERLRTLRTRAESADTRLSVMENKLVQRNTLIRRKTKFWYKTKMLCLDEKQKTEVCKRENACFIPCGYETDYNCFQRFEATVFG